MRSLAVLSILLLGGPALALAPIPQNDAGSGRDSSFMFPVDILPEVVYSGTLIPPDLEDAYNFQAKTGDAFLLATTELCADLVYPSGTRIQLCSFGYATSLPENGTYRLEIKSGINPYQFHISLRENAGPLLTIVPQNDAGSGRDASPTQPVNIEFAKLYRGTLGGSKQDAYDTYRFLGTGGSTLTLTTSGSACFWLITPSGSSLPFTTLCQNHLGAMAGIFTVRLPAGGVYRLHAATTLPQAYGFQITT